MKVLEGKLIGKGQKVAIVVTRFNYFITSKLLEGALDGLRRSEIEEENISVVWVPGAFEVPLVAQNLARSKNYDGILCLGAVIRGDTSHYDYVCNEVSKGIAQVSLRENLPIMFGILTTEDVEQAIERAGTKGGNKGYDCAVSLIEMMNLVNTLQA